MSWTDLSGWWLTEIASDPAYDNVVTPLLLEILEPVPGKTYLDLGSGEGRVASVVAAQGTSVLGLDIAEALARRSPVPNAIGDVLAAPFGDGSVDGAFAVLVLEHVTDHVAFFTEAARIVKPGGVLAIVSNHPMWTATGSTPIEVSDGEVLWRPGDYFSDGVTEVPVDGGLVVFHHRSMSALLSAAGDSGWSLEKMMERPHHDLEDQGGIPRLVACRWRLSH